MAELESTRFCIDMGTTRTRVWLVQKDKVLARSAADFGARDMASRRDHKWLSERLCALLQETITEVRTAFPAPQSAAAAGMITSAQGFVDVPHVSAPAGLEEIAAGMRRVTLPLWSGLPLWLVPGVRTGEHPVPKELVVTTDVMRGEETLCMGLATGELKGERFSLLNLGSHWKWIFVDKGRVIGSQSTLSGELIHVVQNNTLLAASLPSGPPQAFDVEWLNLGMRHGMEVGEARTLFCIRLLELQGHGTPEDRLSYLYGAMLAREIETAKELFSRRGGHVLLCGYPVLAAIWKDCLEAALIPAIIIGEPQKETAYLQGLRYLVNTTSITD